MDNSLLDVRDINHKYIVVGRILKAIGVIKVIEVTGLMLQAEIKRGE